MIENPKIRNVQFVELELRKRRMEEIELTLVRKMVGRLCRIEKLER